MVKCCDVIGCSNETLSVARLHDCICLCFTDLVRNVTSMTSPSMKCNSFFLLPQQVLTYIVVYTYSKITSHKKSYKIFDFKSRDSTFYKAIERRGAVSSMQLIFMTKQRKQILPPKTERYETKINK